jgi:hypothetical protein
MARISDGKSVKVVAPAGGTVQGKFYSINGTFGMAFATVIEGKDVALDIDANGEYSVTQAGVVFSVGETVYFDPATQAFTDANPVGDVIKVGACTNASDANNVFWFTKHPLQLV